MLSAIIKQLNWVDVFILIVLLRIIYIAIKNGLFPELFKLLGTVFALYLSWHYYSRLSEAISGRLSLTGASLQTVALLIFLGLASVGYLFFGLLRRIFCRLFKMESLPKLDKWGGFILGIARGLIYCGMLLFMFAISPIPYLNQSLGRSYFAAQVLEVPNRVYTLLWQVVVSKFMPNDKINEQPFKVSNSLSQK
ncbi:MAG: CvpA family protein [Candidatus Omnitrophota bacterium]